MGSMEPEVVTGLFTLGGVMLGSGVRRRLEWARIRGTGNGAKDTRRGCTSVADQTTIYANFLAVCDSMVAESRSIGTKLAVDESEPVTPETDASITHALGHYAAAWKADFRPALGQVRLIASRQVAELADRVSSAITHTQSSIRERESLQEFDLVWGRTGMLVDVLRDAMRVELGIERRWVGVPARNENWPWIDGLDPVPYEY